MLLPETLVLPAVQAVTSTVSAAAACKVLAWIVPSVMEVALANAVTVLPVIVIFLRLMRPPSVVV